MGHTKIALVLLVLLAFANAFNHVTPGLFNKEATYTWRALVKAGTDLPTTFASQFVLDGKIHLQCTSNSTFVQISDLSYKLYNGILDHVHEYEAQAIATQIEDLQKIFKIVYDTDGHAVGIATEEQEKDFSRNIKKAIATIFQMDKSVLTGKSRTFVSTENSIYGRFKVDYTIKHHGDDIQVDKLHHMDDSHHLYDHMVSNQEAKYCDIGFEQPIMHDSRRNYRLVKQDGQYVVKEISALGTLFYYPFKGKSDNQFVSVNQSFHLDQVAAVQQQFQIQTEHFENDLTYTFDVDVTNGRHSVDYEQVIPTVKNMLQDFYQYLQEDHIHTGEPNTQRGEMVNEIQRLLMSFNSDKLKELHGGLSGSAAEAFYQILPYVGTRASTLFVKHLVVEHAVDSKIAARMLSKFYEHVVDPTVELVEQLEILMNLDDKFEWNVRKIGILGFASLILKTFQHIEKTHKRQEHTMTVNEHHHNEYEKPFEKYVKAYMNQAKNSQDYKVQMAYINGLANMKLQAVFEPMLSATRDEWSQNPHLQTLSFIAVVRALKQGHDRDPFIEVFWPIFTDLDASTEMRTLAFYFIMESNPSASRMMNMYSYLLSEPNQEVYRMVYTYLHEMSVTQNPCRQKYRVKMAQLVSLLPPPAYGMSYYFVDNYHNSEFGFSGGYRNFYINGDHGQIYQWVLGSQHFNIAHKDLLVFIKVNGIQHRLDSISSLSEIFNRKTQLITDMKNFRLEIGFAKHAQFVNCFYFDQHNLHELNEIFDFLTKDSDKMAVNMELLDVDYNEYHKAVIPIDIGMPVIWDYLMPQTVHYNISMTKKVTNNIIDVEIDNRYTNWIHYRHGLTFYNSIADVWQGINRYHSYDSVWPHRLDVTINTQQRSLQVSWKRHNNAHLDIAGYRSHVRQMVFVKDDNKRNVLMQSSPKCKALENVSQGEQFRHDYTVVNEEDLTTGHWRRVEEYDSTNHASNGSLSKEIQQFWQSYHSSQTPLQQLVTSLTHWYQFVILMPKPGSYGYLVRWEPSHRHAVSNIDLSFRLHTDTNDTTFHYTPKTKWSTRVTYSVKDNKKSLKTWDINAIVDMNPGHTVNTLKMHIARIVPGQNDYKICVDGVKKWMEKKVEGHLNVAMSQTPDGKCVKDDTVIDVTMTGQRSHEQEDGRHKYASCQYIIPYSVPHYHTMQCLADHSTVRHYTYNVKTANVPTEFQKTFAHWWDLLKGQYVSYYQYEDEHNDDVPENNLKVEVDYPMQAQQVDVCVTTPQHVYSLTGIPTDYWKWFGIVPDSIEYPVRFQSSHKLGAVDYCIVFSEHFYWNRKIAQQVVPKDWTLYAGNSDQNPQEAVYVKRIAHDQIAVKVVDNGHTFEITPQDDGHTITVDGQMVPSQEYYHNDWVYWHIFTQDKDQSVAVIFKNSGIHLEYFHHRAVVVLPKEEQLSRGHCYRFAQ